MVYECMATQLEAASASFCQAAIAISSQTATATLEEHRRAHFSPLVTEPQALRELVTNVDARLTGIEIPLQR